MSRTLFDKVWDAHVVKDLGDGWVLLHIDRHLLHDLSGPANLRGLQARNLPVQSPGLAFATPDHAVSSRQDRDGEETPQGARLLHELRDLTAAAGVRLFDLGQEGQGIVHVMAPELGVVLPGTTLVCGDSHTCTNGGAGCTRVRHRFFRNAIHVLATQTLLRQKKPKPDADRRATGTLPVLGVSAQGRHGATHHPPRWGRQGGNVGLRDRVFAGSTSCSAIGHRGHA